MRKSEEKSGDYVEERIFFGMIPVRVYAEKLNPRTPDGCIQVKDERGEV